MTRRGQMLRFSDQAEFDAHRRSKDGYVDVYPRATPSEVTHSVLEALRKHPRVAWAHRQNTGAGMLITRAVFERLVATGALRREEARFVSFGWKGQLDITGQMRGGLRLDVEVKSGAGKPTPEQTATMQAIAGAGGVAFVARGVDDVFSNIPVEG